MIQDENVNTLANSGNKYLSNQKYQCHSEIYQDVTYFALHSENKQAVSLFQEFAEMNVSSVNETGTLPPLEPFFSVVTKNVIVTALCVSINYINGTQIHTFTKHQVWEAHLARTKAAIVKLSQFVVQVQMKNPDLLRTCKQPSGFSLILSSALCCREAQHHCTQAARRAYSGHCTAQIPNIVDCIFCHY